jgi:hypothetical protein
MCQELELCARKLVATHPDLFLRYGSLKSSVVDPDPVGSETFSMSGSGFGSETFSKSNPDPDLK